MNGLKEQQATARIIDKLDELGELLAEVRRLALALQEKEADETRRDY